MQPTLLRDNNVVIIANSIVPRVKIHFTVINIIQLLPNCYFSQSTYRVDAFFVEFSLSIKKDKIFQPHDIFIHWMLCSLYCAQATIVSFLHGCVSINWRGMRDKRFTSLFFGQFLFIERKERKKRRNNWINGAKKICIWSNLTQLFLKVYIKRVSDSTFRRICIKTNST